MLKKCLKYDLKSIFGYWLLGALTVLIFSLPAGLSIRSLIKNIEDTNRFPWEVFVVMLYVFVIVGFTILTEILIYVRFYKHFFTDEGYLTFTLPVKRRTLYTSKVLNAFIWNVLTIIIVLISICVLMAFIPSGEMIFTPNMQTPPDLKGWLFLYILEFIVLLLSSSLLGIVSMYLIITIGATIVRKYKIIATIGIGYGSYVVFSALSYLMAFGFALYFVSALTLFPAPSNVPLLLFLIFALVIVIMLSLVVGIVMINLKLIERKLNLT